MSASCYWKSILQRALDVILYCSGRGLPLRGHDEKFACATNGNFMGLLELIAKYDSFLASHIAKQGKPGSGRSSYLSPSTCEELIDLMAQTVLAEVIREIKKSVYYSISIDSTPDISRVDQLTIVVRYVNDQGPVERFLTFLELDVGGHTGAALAKRVLDYLVSIGIDISKCEGQTYDNAANMSGLFNGVRAHIEAVNSLATYIPCAAHSLNLVGSSAANCCSAVRIFFDFVQKLYSFFST